MHAIFCPASLHPSLSQTSFKPQRERMPPPAPNAGCTTDHPASAPTHCSLQFLLSLNFSPCFHFFRPSLLFHAPKPVAPCFCALPPYFQPSHFCCLPTPAAPHFCCPPLLLPPHFCCPPTSAAPTSAASPLLLPPLFFDLL